MSSILWFFSVIRCDDENFDSFSSSLLISAFLKINKSGGNKLWQYNWIRKIYFLKVWKIYLHNYYCFISTWCSWKQFSSTFRDWFIRIVLRKLASPYKSPLSLFQTFRNLLFGYIKKRIILNSHFILIFTIKCSFE